jgi:hypothetical protein
MLSLVEAIAKSLRQSFVLILFFFIEESLFSAKCSQVYGMSRVRSIFYFSETSALIDSLGSSLIYSKLKCLTDEKSAKRVPDDTFL